MVESDISTIKCALFYGTNLKNNCNNIFNMIHYIYIFKINNYLYYTV